MGRKRKTPDQLIAEREALDQKIHRARAQEALSGAVNSPFLVEIVQEIKQLQSSINSAKTSLAESGPLSINQRIQKHQLWIDEYASRLQYEQAVSVNATVVLDSLKTSLANICENLVLDKKPSSKTYEPLVQSALEQAHSLDSGGEIQSLRIEWQDAKVRRESFGANLKAPKNPRKMESEA